MLLLYCIVLEANYRCGGSFVLLLYFVHAKEPAHLITILKDLTCESALQSLLPHLNVASLKLLFCYALFYLITCFKSHIVIFIF